MTAADGSTLFTVTLLSVVGFLVIYVWLALALAAVFRKSGEEAWQAWVPILNLVVLFRLGGLSGWWLLLWLVPFAGGIAVWIVIIVACHRIGAAFGFGGGMTVLAALLLPVWASVIGFGSSRWVGAEAPSGARRTPAAFDDGGLDFLSARPSAPPAASPVMTSPSAHDVPPQPPLPAATPVAAAGWVPPVPSAPPFAPAAAGVAAAAEPSIPDEPWEGVRASDEFTGEVTGAFIGAPAPISAVPGSTPKDDDVVPGPQRASAAAQEVAAPEPPVTSVPSVQPPAPDPEPWAPRPSPVSDPDTFPEASAAVSAVVGSPAVGAPRAARGSVNALYADPEIPEDALEHTIIAHRRRAVWSIVPPSGAPISLTSDVVILGRRPVADDDHPDAQLVSIQDGTVSKTHARLELRDDTWYITDLDSTNGVLFATVLGTEVEATPGVEVEAGDRFLLGDAEVRLVRSEG
jgi:hypothetical protein